MKKSILIFFILNIFCSTLKSQVFNTCENLSVFDKARKPDLGIIISSGDAETVWNALRLALVATSKGDNVVVFVINKAVDVFINGDIKYDVIKISRDLTVKNVDIYTCASCAKTRNTENVQMCTITSLYDMYEIINNSKRVINF
jgi:uncharacterized protein involved in oxidation of intracellular sulfur